MAKEVRQGAGLICVALIALVLSAALEDQGAVMARAVAILFALGGLALVALGLFREST